MRSLITAALLGATACAYVAPLAPRRRTGLRASAFKDNLGREVSEERIEMLKKMGYVYDVVAAGACYDELTITETYFVNFQWDWGGAIAAHRCRRGL